MQDNDLVAIFEAMGKRDADPVAFARSDAVAKAAEAYLANPEEERLRILDALAAGTRENLGRYVARFCGDAIDANSPVWLRPAIMALEISAAAVDWRMQLVRLLIVDHAIRRLAGSGAPFDMDRWRVDSPGTFRSFLQLDKRDPALRNIGSVDIAEIRLDGRTHFRSSS